jgi:hypothetical protein
MNTFPPSARRLSRALRVLFWCGTSAAATCLASAAEDAPRGKTSDFLNSLLPLAWQKRPEVRFNVYTEMTPEGRTRRVPTPENPLRYFASPANFAQTGWSVAAGEKPPPAEQLEAALREALAKGGFVAIDDDHVKPDLLVVFSFGSSGTDPAQVITEAESLGDPNPTSADVLVNALIHEPDLYRDVIARARLVAGDKFAIEMMEAIRGEFSNRRTNQTFDRLQPPPDKSSYLPVSPDGGSPFQLFLQSGNDKTRRSLAELAFHTIYFVTATAYDFAGVANKQKIPLWQTRMVVDAQGVAMAEILKPLIVNTGAYIGRETPEAVIVDKRINREGRVDVGTPTVVKEGVPAPTPNPPPR